MGFGKCFYNKMSERKLVEAFKTFFQRSVSHMVSGNDEIMREWNHLNKIISNDPVDCSQIEFYLLLSNKNNSPKPGSFNRIPDSDPNRFKYSGFNAMMDNKSSLAKKDPQGASAKKKNLVASLESFQKQLLYNHERLQALNKKDAGGPTQGGVNTSANGISLRRY